MAFGKFRTWWGPVPIVQLSLGLELYLKWLIPLLTPRATHPCHCAHTIMLSGPSLNLPIWRMGTVMTNTTQSCGQNQLTSGRLQQQQGLERHRLRLADI